MRMVAATGASPLYLPMQRGWTFMYLRSTRNHLLCCIMVMLR